MDLSELLDQKLEFDQWSTLCPTFGEFGQLSVIGWSGKRGSTKLYIVKCSICSEDHELFGEGCFKITKGHLKEGRVPCGCGTNVRWTKDQYAILCKRKAEDLGNRFIEFNSDKTHYNAKITLECPTHGQWTSCTINNLINHSHSCPSCKREKTVERKRKSDEEMIASFFASGSFHPDTKFKRSERRSKQGWRVYWIMECPLCNSTGEATSLSFQRGSMSCDCGRSNQKQAYINLISNSENYQIALKFGIAVLTRVRVSRQNKLSPYKVINYLVYEFTNSEDCKKAEKDCLKELECGLLSKEEMPDGHTETTDVLNLDKIIEIYERNGGKLKI